MSEHRLDPEISAAGRLDRLRQIDIEQVATRVSLAPGELAVREGEITGRLYVVEDGLVEVFQMTADREEVVLARLQEGEIFGEIALLGKVPHSASVRAVQPTRLLAIPYDELHQLAEKGALSLLLFEIGHSLSTHLMRASEHRIEAVKKQLDLSRSRVAAGRFMVWVMMTSALYTGFTKVLSGNILPADTSTLVTCPIALFVAGVVLWLMYRSGLPMKTYGLTLEGCRRHVLQALVWTLPVVVLMVVIKWLLISYMPGFGQLSLIARQDLSQRTVLLLVYVVVLVPLQELGARGGLQSSLYIFLAGSHRQRTFWSILVANTLFAMGHLHLTLVFTVVAFCFGLFWGWMYARQRSLVGPILSHFLIGLIGLWVLGFDEILQQMSLIT